MASLKFGSGWLVSRTNPEQAGEGRAKKNNETLQRALPDLPLKPIDNPSALQCRASIAKSMISIMSRSGPRDIKEKGNFAAGGWNLSCGRCPQWFGGPRISR